MRPSSATPAPATPPNEPRGWSFPALLEAFAAALPSWLRRFGVSGGDMPDAVQEALISFWQDSADIPQNPREARVELLRRAARVALRARRHARRRDDRFVLAEDVEALDPLDVEAWVEARVILLEALELLDEPTRALLVARFLEGRTNAEIADELGEKEDTIEQRVIRGRERLRKEINLLLGEPKKKERKEKKRIRAALLPLGLLGVDPFDRAILGAMLEAEGKTPPIFTPPPPVSAVVPIVVAAAPAIFGPLLGGIAAVVLGLFFLFAPRLPSTPSAELPPDMGYAMRAAPRIELVSAAAVPIPATTAAPVTPPPAVTAASSAQTSAPRRKASPQVALPEVTPEKLAEYVAKAREVHVGKGPQ